MKFKYKFQLEPNGAYGSLKNGKWTGMIAELRSQQADMAAIDMSITSIRQQAVDFTMPFMNTGEAGDPNMAAIDMSITSIRQQAVDFTMPFMNTGEEAGDPDMAAIDMSITSIRQQKM